MMTKPPISPVSDALQPEPIVATSATTAGVAKSSIRQRLERLFADYGPVAVVTYFVIFFGTWGGFAAALSFGIQMEGVAAGAGTIGAAWLATKVTQPLRIGATIVATPFAARLWHRLRPRPSRVVAASDPPPASTGDEG
jgi:hypothetical protein